MNKRLQVVILGALAGLAIAYITKIFTKDVSLLLGVAFGTSIGIIFSSKYPKTTN